MLWWESYGISVFELGKHPFLQGTNIPTRRFAREQVAAQIIAQVFSLRAKREFRRTRHSDLMELFKEHATLDQGHGEIVENIRRTFDILEPAFRGSQVLRSRSLILSIVLLALSERVTTSDQAGSLAQFVEEFICRLQWQLKKGYERDSEYQYLLDFQRHVTQASVEKAAVAARAETLGQEYDRWRAGQNLRGDAEYERRTGTSPSEACRASSRA